MLLAPEEIAIVGTLGGVFLASIFNLVNNWMTKRSDERRQFRELVINAAIENWKEKTDQTIKLQARSPGSTGTIYPLGFLIVYMAKICDVGLKPNVSHDELTSKSREAGDMLEALIAERIREQEDRALQRREP